MRMVKMLSALVVVGGCVTGYAGVRPAEAGRPAVVQQVSYDRGGDHREVRVVDRGDIRDRGDVRDRGRDEQRDRDVRHVDDHHDIDGWHRRAIDCR